MTEIIKMKGETMEERLQMADEISRGYFRQGLNCAECVFKTFLDIYDVGLPAETVALSTGFGGGIGHTKEGTCGAVSGAVMALGAVKGRRDPLAGDDMAERVALLQKQLYPKFADLIKDVQADKGAVNCMDLVADYEDFMSKERKKNCMGIIAACAVLMVRHIEKED